MDISEAPVEERIKFDRQLVDPSSAPTFSVPECLRLLAKNSKALDFSLKACLRGKETNPVVEECVPLGLGDGGLSLYRPETVMSTTVTDVPLELPSRCSTPSPTPSPTQDLYLDHMAELSSWISNREPLTLMEIYRIYETWMSEKVEAADGHRES